MASLRMTMSDHKKWEGGRAYYGFVSDEEPVVVGRPSPAAGFEAFVVPEAKAQVIPPKT